MDPGSEGDRHRYYEELAVSHVLGGLSESDGRAFRSHLLDCPHCRARVGELRRIANDLADVERDERRVRAAKAIETKRREDDDEGEVEEPQPSSRGSRIATLVGLIVLVGLASWNFLLRDMIAEQNSRLEEARITTDLLIENNDALHSSPTGQFSAAPNRVVFNEEWVVVVMDDVEAGAVYAIYLLSEARQGEDEQVIDMNEQTASASRMTLLVPRAPGLRNLVVTQPEDLPAERDAVDGVTVLTATVPTS
jgi:hypothetical protein